MSKTIERIENFSAKEGIDFLQSKNKNLIFKSGSTFVYITVHEDSSGEWVYFLSLVVKDAKIDNKLMEMLLRLNAELPFGAFGLEKNYIIFKHSILGGEHMDEEEFFQSLYSVARIADEYDDIIINSHGGKKAMDVLIEDLFRNK